MKQSTPITASIALFSVLALPTLAGAQTRAGATASKLTTRAESIRDQAGSGWLEASSTPTQGMLFPYPGSNNTFATTALVAGGTNNDAAAGSFVGGGSGNSASGYYNTISGGDRNSATAFRWAAVGGGYSNSASGIGSTIAGGEGNSASSFHATVGGGFSNRATGYGSTVSGGLANMASAGYATVAGGGQNTALARCSFAAGYRAKANHEGAFVWADSTEAYKASSANDEFNVYAEGGARFFAVGATSPSLALTDSGETVQPVASSGLVKAGCHVDGVNVTISRSFNNLPGGSAITVTRLGPGQFEVDFGVDITSRHYTASLGSGTIGAASKGGISVQHRNGNANALFVHTWNSSWADADNAFFVSVQ